jgi:hypothetical protein
MFASSGLNCRQNSCLTASKNVTNLHEFLNSFSDLLLYRNIENSCIPQGVIQKYDCHKLLYYSKESRRNTRICHEPLYSTYCHVKGVCVININGFWIWWFVYWKVFTITTNYNSSHIELLLNYDSCLTNLYEESLTAWNESRLCCDRRSVGQSVLE